jgi:hypothetical protein|tara:strand:+ start:437 stop:793 length:357 start_codon:yes stop_codon:yes gene_type:complete
MSEKKGHLVKLHHDFDTAAVLEVWMPKLDGWYRVTSREFRSFDGERRYTKPIRPQGLGEVNDIEMVTTEYNGPVFLWGTNNNVPYKGTHTMVESTTSRYFDKKYKEHTEFQSGSKVRT